MDVRLTGRELTGVFRICYNNRLGTAFLYHAKEGCVFVTAAHVLDGLQVGEYVLLQRNQDWFRLTTTEFIQDPNGYDVCIFSGENLYIESLRPPYGGIGMELGALVRFAGFPHSLTNTYPGEDFPAPLVRTAFFSGVVNLQGQDIMLLDGFNNPGYSGAPVFGKGKDEDVTLIGVISAYRHEVESHGAVYRKEPGGKEELLPDIYVKPNSGMIYCVSRKRIDPLIAEAKVFNPLGRPS